MLAKTVDKFPKWAKILLVIVGFASIVYRVFLFVDDCIDKKEEKHVMALVTAILAIVIPIVLYVILAIIDIITLATRNEFSTHYR